MIEEEEKGRGKEKEIKEIRKGRGREKNLRREKEKVGREVGIDKGRRVGMEEENNKRRRG